MRIVSASGTEVCSSCIHARSLLRRLRGLLGRPALAPGTGLLLTPCASVHTLFLRHAIEVLFLGTDGTILRVVPALRPWRFAAHSGARSVLELPPGTCGRLGVARGDLLLLAAATSPMVQYEIADHPLPPLRGDRPGVNGIQGFSKSRRMRRGAVAAACLVAAATGAAALSSCASDTKDQAKAAAPTPIQRGDMLVVGLDRSKPRTYGNASASRTRPEPASASRSGSRRRRFRHSRRRSSTLSST